MSLALETSIGDEFMVHKQKSQKLWIVDWFTLRRHSRVLYLPLDRTIVDLYDLQKGDRIKAVLLSVLKQPRDEEESEETKERS